MQITKGPAFDAVLNGRGQYNTFQFVLRLSPEVHRLLSLTPSGVYSPRELGFDRAQAFSTLLHETVHWWQHVGSTYGLMLSLTHPVQLHGNYNYRCNCFADTSTKRRVSHEAIKGRAVDEPEVTVVSFVGAKSNKTNLTTDGHRKVIDGTGRLNDLPHGFKFGASPDADHIDRCFRTRSLFLTIVRKNGLIAVPIPWIGHALLVLDLRRCRQRDRRFDYEFGIGIPLPVVGLGNRRGV